MQTSSGFYGPKDKPSRGGTELLLIVYRDSGISMAVGQEEGGTKVPLYGAAKKAHEKRVAKAVAMLWSAWQYINWMHHHEKADADAENLIKEAIHKFERPFDLDAFMKTEAKWITYSNSNGRVPRDGRSF